MLTIEMKQSRLTRKAEKLVKKVYQWRSLLTRRTRSLILAALLFVLSMAVPPVVANVPGSIPIVGSQQDPVGLVEKAKKLYETGDLYQFALTLLQMKLANTRRMTSDV